MMAQTMRGRVGNSLALMVLALTCWQEAFSFSQHYCRQRASLLCITGKAKDQDETAIDRQRTLNTSNTIMHRRDMLRAGVALSVLTTLPKPSVAIDKTSIAATWSATDGLKSLDEGKEFVSFDVTAYRAMRDDPTRTPLFEKAILNRLGNNPEAKVVVDLGTGPFALFAIMAAEAGARKVYAIEASPAAANSARQCAQRAGFGDVITVLQGFSTDISLPEKADLCIAEIVGSIATEEGAYATIRDAHKRFVKEPNLDSSWIPSRIQTYMAPASYTLHNLFGPPEFDWSKLQGEPVRFNCRDKGLALLADPVLVEDVVFSEILSPQQDARMKKKEFNFVVDADRVNDNTLSMYDEFRRGKSSVKDSEILAQATAHSFSGVAMWPRLLLDDTTTVNAREYGTGGYQRSHWQTVLPIMSSRPVSPFLGGEQIFIATDFQISANDVTKSPVYSITGTIG